MLYSIVHNILLVHDNYILFTVLYYAILFTIHRRAHHRPRLPRCPDGDQVDQTSGRFGPQCSVYYSSGLYVDIHIPLLGLSTSRVYMYTCIYTLSNLTRMCISCMNNIILFYIHIYIHICIHIAFVPYLQLLQLAAAVEKRGSDGVLWRAGTQLRASSQTL